MTDHALTSMRLVLERARLLLEPRSDAEARDLIHDLRNVIGGIAFLEAEPELPSWTEHAPAVAVAGRAVLDRVRAYALERGLALFVIRDTPAPFDTIVMTRDEIRAAIDEMPPDAVEPPPTIAAVISEAQSVGNGPWTVPASSPTKRTGDR